MRVKVGGIGEVDKNASLIKGTPSSPLQRIPKGHTRESFAQFKRGESMALKEEEER